MNFIWPILALISSIHAQLIIESPITQAANTGLEDDLQFLFKWQSATNLASLDDDFKKSVEFLDFKTTNNEKYKCAIPVLNDQSQKSSANDDQSESAQIQTAALLADFHQRKLCSYRIESYWIYELCHGTFVRQYHETKSAGKILVTGEYYLGYFDAAKQHPDYLKQNDNNFIPSVVWKNLNGEKVPTYAVKYTDGTLCEILKDTKREITVFYACEEFGNDNIVSFEEISSCVYEMVVVSKWICSHPAYKIPEKVYPTINCFSIDNSPPKPSELVKIEDEQINLKTDKNKVQMTNKAGETFIIHYKTIDDDGIESVEEIKPQEQVKQEPVVNPPVANDDAQKQVIKSFLKGENCLTGGAGWWKFEVCFNKHVIQYHDDDQTKKRQTIVLGTWNEENHLKWIGARPNKRPLEKKSERVYSSLLFTDGNKCDETNRNRFVEVKFKCLRNKPNSGAISLYLIEPATCEYLLSVESPWLCDYIESVDLNGLNPPNNP